MIITGLIGGSELLLTSKSNFLYRIIVIAAGALVVAIELEKLPLVFRIPLKIHFNRGLTFIVIGLMFLLSGIGSVLVFISGIIYIWDKLEKILK
jgi:hypothetical protein